MDLPKDVLPTPGGPVKHKIGPFTASLFVTFFFSDRTAKYSKTRSLTLSKP